MRSSASVSVAASIAVALAVGAAAQAAPSEARPSAPTSASNEQTRRELIAAREAIWRAFFEADPAKVETLLGPELIAIQQHQSRWESRERLVALARRIRQANVRVQRLEFPHTEIQVFGDVAVMYYTYVFETGDGVRSSTDSGRGTEIFVRRNGAWIDVGWHLDNGPFVRTDGAWRRRDDASPR